MGQKNVFFTVDCVVHRQTQVLVCQIFIPVIQCRIIVCAVVVGLCLALILRCQLGWNLCQIQLACIEHRNSSSLIGYGQNLNAVQTDLFIVIVIWILRQFYLAVTVFTYNERSIVNLFIGTSAELIAIFLNQVFTYRHECTHACHADKVISRILKRNLQGKVIQCLDSQFIHRKFTLTDLGTVL